MKKSLILLSALLLLSFVGMMFLTRNSSYSGEKKLWKMTRQYGAIIKNHEGTPQAKYDNLLARFDRFIQSHEELKITSVAYIMRARLFTVQEKHAQATSEINRALTAFADKKEITIQLLLEQAQMYAIQSDRLGVNRTYQRIIQDYPLSVHGLQGPLVLAKYFVQTRDAEGAKKAYQSAIEHYKGLIKQHPDSAVEFQTRILLAESYNSLEDWDRALNVFKETLLKFANPTFWNQNSFLHVTQSINTITIIRKNDSQAALAIYESFLSKYPDHPFSQDISEIMKKIQQLEAERARNKAATSTTESVDEAQTSTP